MQPTTGSAMTTTPQAAAGMPGPTAIGRMSMSSGASSPLRTFLRTETGSAAAGGTVVVAGRDALTGMSPDPTTVIVEVCWGAAPLARQGESGNRDGWNIRRARRSQCSSLLSVPMV